MRTALHFILVGLACHAVPSAAPTPTAATHPSKPLDGPVVEIVYDHAFAGKWEDYGWAPRKLGHLGGESGPARINFADHGGWILAHPGGVGAVGALRFQVKAPSESHDFLEVHLDSDRGDNFPRTQITADRRTALADGFSQVTIPISELNPEGLPFDRVVFRASGYTGSNDVLLDNIVFLAESVDPNLHVKKPVPVVEAKLSVRCEATSRPIHDMIYGIAFGDEKKDPYVVKLGATTRRWGGNPTSTYNWKLGNAWNTSNDWFFHNVAVPLTADRFLDDNVKSGVKSALTVPILGWVAKDTKSCAFPIDKFGEQQQKDPYSPCGNGIAKSGGELTPLPPSETSVEAPPEFIGEWVKKISEDDKKRGKRSVDMYILDNEPGLWNSTHRDLHPKGVSYDELLKRTVDYGTAVRKADPQALIAGPAEWGWPNYFYSGQDGVTKFKLNPDRLAHGNVPLLAWYLRKLHESEQATGVHLLDVLDVHYYPMANGVGIGTKGGLDKATAALRLRSTRSLWDPTYVDESWIGDTVRLIPRLQEWIDANDPGLGISIGEWNFGAEQDISGGLAVAEVLGRFGQFGVTSAFYWSYPPDNSPAFWAFRAYRNFDDHGGHFLSQSIPTETVDGVSLFASRDADNNHLVLVALNLRPDAELNAHVDLSACGTVTSQRVFSYAKDNSRIVPQQGSAGASDVGTTLAPYSITVFDVTLNGASSQPH